MSYYLFSSSSRFVIVVVNIIFIIIIASTSTSKGSCRVDVIHVVIFRRVMHRIQNKKTVSSWNSGWLVSCSYFRGRRKRYYSCDVLSYRRQLKFILELLSLSSIILVITVIVKIPTIPSSSALLLPSREESIHHRIIIRRLLFLSSLSSTRNISNLFGNLLKFSSEISMKSHEILTHSTKE